MGLRINLALTIGNNNDEFIEKWHKRLEAFSITIIEDIVEFCDKTINEAKITEHAVKENVKSKTTPDTNKEILNAITENQKEHQQNLKDTFQNCYKLSKFSHGCENAKFQILMFEQVNIDNFGHE